jgi:hypothetical protein
MRVSGLCECLCRCAAPQSSAFLPCSASSCLRSQELEALVGDGGSLPGTVVDTVERLQVRACHLLHPELVSSCVRRVCVCVCACVCVCVCVCVLPCTGFVLLLRVAGSSLAVPAAGCIVPSHCGGWSEWCAATAPMSFDVMD